MYNIYLAAKVWWPAIFLLLAADEIFNLFDVFRKMRRVKVVNYSRINLL
jgi:hypothetical protein